MGKVITFIIWLLLIIGYVKCVIKFVQCDFELSYKAEAIYGIGLCTGLGSIVGWLDIPDIKTTNK